MPILTHLQTGRNVKQAVKKLAQAIQSSSKLKIDECADDIAAARNLLQDLEDENEGE